MQVVMREREGRGVIRVLLVDDHAMVRQGLRSLLATYHDFEIVGEASNGEEALCLVQQLAPSVVVMDINMPKLNGIEATARIKRTYPHVVIVGLSVNASDENRSAMTAAGATMLLTKEAAVEQLYLEIKASFSKRSSAIH
jgi:DNA-binding NarL/FixJ family response regulator